MKPIALTRPLEYKGFTFTLTIKQVVDSRGMPKDKYDLCITQAPGNTIRMETFSEWFFCEQCGYGDINAMISLCEEKAIRRVEVHLGNPNLLTRLKADDWNEIL